MKDWFIRMNIWFIKYDIALSKQRLQECRDVIAHDEARLHYWQMKLKTSEITVIEDSPLWPKKSQLS